MMTVEERVEHLMNQLPYLHKTVGGVAGFKETLRLSIKEAMRDQRHACADTVAAIENPFLLNLSEGSTSLQAARHDGFQAAKTRIHQAVMNTKVKK